MKSRSGWLKRKTRSASNESKSRNFKMWKKCSTASRTPTTWDNCCKTTWVTNRCRTGAQWADKARRCTKHLCFRPVTGTSRPRSSPRSSQSRRTRCSLKCRSSTRSCTKTKSKGRRRPRLNWNRTYSKRTRSQVTTRSWMTTVTPSSPTRLKGKRHRIRFRSCLTKSKKKIRKGKKNKISTN